MKIISLAIVGGLLVSYLSANTIADKAYRKAIIFSKEIANSSNKKELYKKATRQYIIACKNGKKEACDMVENFALIKLKSNTFEAVKLLKLSCDNNNAEACGLLSDIYYKGLNKTRKNKKLATKLLKKSSSLGYERASLVLAEKYISGNNIKKNKKKGISILSKSCKNKQNQACVILAKIKYNGIYGIKKDPDQALELLTNSCENKSGKACYDKAVIMADIASKTQAKGELLSKKTEEILANMKISCDLGYKKACKYIKN